MRALVIFLLFISVTKSEQCNGKLCLQKCCEIGQFASGRKNCTNNDTEGPKTELLNTKVYLPSPLHKGNMTAIGTIDANFELKPGYFSNKDIKENSVLYVLYYSAYYVLQNGSAMLQRRDSDTFDVVNPDEYCLEYWTSARQKQVALFFANVGKKQENPKFFKYGFLISSIFLLLLLIVYCLLPELINLGGMILMAYVTSLMLAFVFLFVMQIAVGTLTIPLCKAFTYLIYFFFLASFCWMNVMSFDIWWTFRGYAKARPIHRRGANFKFAMYSLFAWSVPLAMTIALAVLNDIDAKRLPGIIKPEVPDKGCFIEGEAKLVYMYLPMLIMILLNWTFFGLTVFNIWRLSRGNNILSGGDSASSGTASAHRTQKHRFIVYLKLSVVMGLNWLVEVVSSFYPDSPAWYIFDTYNIFTGLIIFVIFVCKKKILKKLKKRCCGVPSPTSSEVPSQSERPLCLRKAHYSLTANVVAYKDTGSLISRKPTFHQAAQTPAQKAEAKAHEAQWSQTHRVT